MATTAAAAITSSGTKSPMATRKEGFGNTNGARANATSSTIPNVNAEIRGRDTTLHHMMFKPGCLDHGMVTTGY